MPICQVFFCHFYTFYSQLIATKNTLRIFNSQCAFLIAVLLFIQFINSLIITIVPIDISQPLPQCFATLSAKSNAIRYNITSAFITKSLIISLFLNLCHGNLTGRIKLLYIPCILHLDYNSCIRIFRQNHYVTKTVSRLTI